MEKTALGLIAALGVVTPIAAAQAAVAPQEAQRALHAQSIAELLDPIPNALEVMRVTETERAATAEAAQDKPQLMAWHHHHWHHHHWHHHHWHHHHHWYHHHHWHHHHWWHHHHHWY